jgi:hypothetical protein
MRLTGSLSISLASAIVVPLIAVVGLIVLERTFEEVVPWYGTAASIWMACAAGFVFVARQFRWYSVLLAAPYFAAMYFVVLFWGLMFIGWVYGDYI